MFELLRKKHINAVNSRCAVKMIRQTKHLLPAEYPDLSKLSQLKLSLNEELKVLKELDNKILCMFEEDKVAGEIEQSDRFKERLYTAMVRVKHALAPLNPPLPSSLAVVPVSSSVSIKLKLPRHSLQLFDSESTTLTPFWNFFKVAVHDNCLLLYTDRLYYLQGLLQPIALQPISWLPLTIANYQEAVSILQKRFGNKSQIIGKHMDILIHVDEDVSSV